MSFGFFYPHLVDEALINQPSPLTEPDISLEELDMLLDEHDRMIEEQKIAQTLGPVSTNGLTAHSSHDEDVIMQDADTALSQISLSEKPQTQDLQDSEVAQRVSLSASSQIPEQPVVLPTSNHAQNDMDVVMKEASQPSEEGEQKSTSSTSSPELEQDFASTTNSIEYQNLEVRIPEQTSVSITDNSEQQNLEVKLPEQIIAPYTDHAEEQNSEVSLPEQSITSTADNPEQPMDLPEQVIASTADHPEQSNLEVSVPEPESSLDAIDDLDQIALKQGRPSPVTKHDTAVSDTLHTTGTRKKSSLPPRKSLRISALQEKADTPEAVEVQPSLEEQAQTGDSEVMDDVVENDHKKSKARSIIPQKRKGKVGPRELNDLSYGDAESWKTSESKRPKKTRGSTTPQIKEEQGVGMTRRSSVRLNPPVSTKPKVITAASTRVRRNAGK